MPSRPALSSGLCTRLHLWIRHTASSCRSNSPVPTYLSSLVSLSFFGNSTLQSDWTPVRVLSCPPSSIFPLSGAGFTVFSQPSVSPRSVSQFSRSVVSDSLWPRESQHARPPCPSPTPGVYSNSCPSSRWCHPAISSSVVPFSSCLQSFPASGSFPVSQLFAWGGQSIGDSASTSVPSQFLKILSSLQNLPHRPPRRPRVFFSCPCFSPEWALPPRHPPPARSSSFCLFQAGMHVQRTCGHLTTLPACKFLENDNSVLPICKYLQMHYSSSQSDIWQVFKCTVCEERAGDARFVLSPRL